MQILKEKIRKFHFFSNLCRNWSVWGELLSLDGPGLETDALFTWPFDETDELPRLNSVEVLFFIHSWKIFVRIKRVIISRIFSDMSSYVVVYYTNNKLHRKPTHVLSVDAFVFSVDEVFSYKVVDLRGISPAVRLPLVALSNLLIVVRGFAGDVNNAKKLKF